MQNYTVHGPDAVKVSLTNEIVKLQAAVVMMQSSRSENHEYDEGEVQTFIQPKKHVAIYYSISVSGQWSTCSQHLIVYLLGGWVVRRNCAQEKSYQLESYPGYFWNATSYNYTFDFGLLVTM